MEPPPFPAFVSLIEVVFLNLVQLCSDDGLVIPPPFPILVIHTVLVVMAVEEMLRTLNRPLVARLFPTLLPAKNNGRDVWSVLELDPRNFWCVMEKPQGL